MIRIHRNGRAIRPVKTIDGRRHYQCNGEWCNRAGLWLHESEFYRLSNVASLCGRTSECKLCMNQQRVIRKRIDLLHAHRRRVETVVRSLHLEVARDHKRRSTA